MNARLLDEIPDDIQDETQDEAPDEAPEEKQMDKRAEFLFHEQRLLIVKRIDHLMGYLLIIQWIAVLILAIAYSPRAWNGFHNPAYSPVFKALVFGGLIVVAPAVAAFQFSGRVWTRHLISICQMFMSALVINLCAGRSEAHFHIFVSLVILSLYRDWKVLLSATFVMTLDQLIRGVWAPMSAFGVVDPQPFRWLEQLFWMACEDAFLIVACLQNLSELRTMSERQAALEFANQKQDLIEQLALTQATLTSQANEVGHVVDSLYSSGQRMTAAISELASNAHQTLTAITETTTIVDEVRQTAEVSSQKARKVCEDAQSVLSISERGKEATDEAVKGMSRIRTQMESIAQSMVHLSDQSKLIGDIITVVDDLAQQSNLLSVNASIEAAKAGEHGKGFAVVAQEVKNLSRQSKDATARVRRILSDIGKAITAATMATELGTKAVGAGEEVGNQARDSILTLAANIDQSVNASTQIEVSSQQQLVGMQQVVTAMESVRQASDHNVKSVGELESAVTKLNELGKNLRALTKR